MSKIIIGIHGLGNKPPLHLLTEWWKASLREGFERAGLPFYFFKMEMAFWADVLYSNQLNPYVADKDDPLCITDPYAPSSDTETHKPNSIKKSFLDVIEKQLDNLALNPDKSINLSKISDYIVHKYFTDLELYYSSNQILDNNKSRLVREVIRDRLIKTLHKHKHKKILLIAHSMGTIIAYDVLSTLPKNISIDTLITIGSPLGIPMMKQKIAEDHNIKLSPKHKLPTPENIKRAWYNFSDLDDKVAFNYNLNDDYFANSKGVVPLDTIIHNDFISGDESNPHKSYGYLRTRELSEKTFEFLTRDAGKFSLWFNQQTARLLDKIF